MKDTAGENAPLSSSTANYQVALNKKDTAVENAPPHLIFNC